MLMVLMGLTQCRISRPVVENIRGAEEGLDGYRSVCGRRDSVESVTISRVNALIHIQEERYEARLILYHRFDSIIFVSAVSGGFEVLRGTADRDSIRVIDRINKIVYVSSIHRNLGYELPVTFKDLECMTNLYGCCGLIEHSGEFKGQDIIFDLSGDFMNKKIYLDRESFGLSGFEFINTRSNEYFTGKKEADGGFRIFSNFIIDAFELEVEGGERVYNRKMAVNMEFNRKRYDVIKIQ